MEESHTFHQQGRNRNDIAVILFIVEEVFFQLFSRLNVGSNKAQALIS